MFRFRVLSVTCLVVGFFASMAFAGPITFDGTVGPTEYMKFLNDDNAEGDFGTPSFDIDRVGFDQDADWLYVGIDTIGTYDPNGNDEAFPQSTFVNLVLADGSSTLHFSFASSDLSNLMYLDGVPLLTGWEAAYDQDLELRLDNTLFAGFNTADMSVRMSLEDLEWEGTADVDDVAIGQVVGVPEPASLALLAMGMGAVLIRRRP